MARTPIHQRDRIASSFETNVFVNCPFDDEYIDLLRPLLFTLVYLKYTPRIATESSDAGEARIQKILALIEDSKFGIHDLSRIQAKEAGEVFRFNMPFELGLDYACKAYKGGKWKTKKCLVLETERYRYQAAISDISNSDIKAHKNQPDEVVRQVRNWLAQDGVPGISSPTMIWDLFNEFIADLYDHLKDRGFSNDDIEQLPVKELLSHMKRWCTDRIL